MFIKDNFKLSLCSFNDYFYIKLFLTWKQVKEVSIEDETMVEQIKLIQEFD
jgi:hypothetical protein